MGRGGIGQRGRRRYCHLVNGGGDDVIGPVGGGGHRRVDIQGLMVAVVVTEEGYIYIF